MAKKSTEPTVKPVRPMDPAWRIKFEPTKETVSDKKSPNKKPAKGATAK